MAESSSKDNEDPAEISQADKYFVEQRDLILQDVNQTLDSILNGLNGLNISLENFIAVGKEFENVTELWKTFYCGLSSGNDVSGAATNSNEIDQSPSGE